MLFRSGTTGLVVGVNARQLAAIADALGVDELRLTFSLEEPEKRAFMVTPIGKEGGYGVVCAIRLG